MRARNAINIECHRRRSHYVISIKIEIASLALVAALVAAGARTHPITATSRQTNKQTNLRLTNPISGGETSRETHIECKSKLACCCLLLLLLRIHFQLEYAREGGQLRSDKEHERANERARKHSL